MIIVLLFSALAYGQAAISPVESTNDLLIQAAADVLLDRFLLDVDAVYVTVLLKNDLSNPIARILSRIGHPLPIIIKSIVEPAKLNFTQHYNLLLVDSWHSIDQLRVFLKMKQFDFTGIYLIVVLPSETVCGILTTALLELTGNLHIYDVNVLCPRNDSVVLRTYFPYGHLGHSPYEHLENPKPHISKWNIYQRSTGFIHRKPHYPNKLANFYGSSLRVALFNALPFMKLVRDSNNRTIDYEGIDGHLLKKISKSLNFTIEPFEESELWGSLSSNGTATGAIALVMNGTVNLTLSFFGNSFLRQQFMSASKSYYQSSLILIVTPGTEYGSFEKLLLPFQLTLWIGFSMVLINALLTIAILRLFPPSIQHFVFGRANWTPVLNFYLSTLGYAVNPSPTRNFARFLLMLWIVGTLILRTAYQQEMFHFLHHALNRSTVHGWNEFTSSGYHIYLDPSALYLFESSHESIKRTLRVIPRSENNSTLEEIRYARVRGARISYTEKFSFLNQEALRDGGPFYEQFSERIYSHPIHVFFPKNSPLVQTFDNQIEPLVTHGFIRYWAHLILNRNLLRDIRIRAKQARNAPLTLRMLDGVFEIYGIGLVCAGFSFIAEKSIAYCRKLRA